MADSNIQTPDTVKPITLDEYEERTAHLQENTTSLLSAISDRQVQAAGLATQAYSLAAEANAVAEQASLSFSKKTWEDNATSGTPITAAELNRLENAISNLTTAVNNLQDSVSHTVLYKNAKGTTTNFVLSEAVTDFEYVDIYYRSGVVRMYPADYVTVVLSANAFNKDGSLDVEGAYLSFSGKAATFTNANHKLFYKSNGYATFDHYSEVHQHLAVVLVLGYKQHSVTQTTELLWQGSIHNSGSAVVSSNLSKHKLLGFKFNLSPNIAIAKASQQQVTDAVKYNWGIRAAEANFTIRDNTITFSDISFAQFVCNHLGESLVFNAGDATNITEIWGL